MSLPLSNSIWWWLSIGRMHRYICGWYVDTIAFVYDHAFMVSLSSFTTWGEHCVDVSIRDGHDEHDTRPSRFFARGSLCERQWGTAVGVTQLYTVLPDRSLAYSWMTYSFAHPAYWIHMHTLGRVCRIAYSFIEFMHYMMIWLVCYTIAGLIDIICIYTCIVIWLFTLLMLFDMWCLTLLCGYSCAMTYV